jgi:hypothetical protein
MISKVSTGVAVSVAERRRSIYVLRDFRRSTLARHRNVAFHFTPTYSSWLNQVEIWFSKLQREVIDRGIFTSLADLRRKIMRYIRKNRQAIPMEVHRFTSPCARMVKVQSGQPTSENSVENSVMMSGGRLQPNSKHQFVFFRMLEF